MTGTHTPTGRKDSPGIVSADFPRPPTRNFAGLLRSCRALYAEVATLLYSANQFVVFHQGSLDPLQALSSTALASLTRLKIVLNESSCHQPIDSYNYPPPCCCDDIDDVPFPATNSFHCAQYRTSNSRSFLPFMDPAPPSATRFHLIWDAFDLQRGAQATLTTWHDTAAYLSSHVSGGRLTLSLVCDIDHRHEYALEAAGLAVAPLAMFPRLKECHVRLCKRWNRPLQQLAESTVLQACGNASPLGLASSKVPALTNLPPELRLRILEYTDLITPWNEVTWCGEYRRYQLRRPPCLAPEGGCPPYIHHGCRLSRCLGVDSSYLPPLSPGCFCRRRHAAFSITCNCWAPPTSLFLICRLLYRDATLVFFSGNRFIVHDFQATPSPALAPIQDQPQAQETTGPPDATSALGPSSNEEQQYPYERLTASHFLRNAVPADCLGHLRFLELVFPPYPPHSWPLKHPALGDWYGTINWLRSKINAPALTIRLVFYDFSHRSQAASRWELSKEQGMQIVRGYECIIYALRPLLKDDGLAGLYVQAAYPWRWVRNTIRFMRLPGNASWLEETEQGLKEHLEHIPGCEDIVDSRSKPEPRKSVWQHWDDAPVYCWTEADF